VQVLNSAAIPDDLHISVASALRVLKDNNMFKKDVVSISKQVAPSKSERERESGKYSNVIQQQSGVHLLNHV